MIGTINMTLPLAPQPDTPLWQEQQPLWVYIALSKVNLLL